MSLDDLEKRKKAREEFISILSSKEKLLREILGVLKDVGFFYRADFNPKTVDLSKIFAPPYYSL